MTPLPFVLTVSKLSESPSFLVFRLIGATPDQGKCFIGRTHSKSVAERVLARAFDKAIRSKPRAFAADAGLPSRGNAGKATTCRRAGDQNRICFSYELAVHNRITLDVSRLQSRTSQHDVDVAVGCVGVRDTSSCA
jgi:hypothetical protein